MTTESLEYSSDREHEIAGLIKQLRTLQMSYWLPRIDSGSKGDIEREADQICDRLVELGVDLEALDRTETLDSE